MIHHFIKKARSFHNDLARKNDSYGESGRNYLDE